MVEVCNPEFRRSYLLKGKIMKNVRVKVRKTHYSGLWDYGIYEGNKRLMANLLRHNGYGSWELKGIAIRNAKAMAKQIGIKYDPEIVKQYKC